MEKKFHRLWEGPECADTESEWSRGAEKIKLRKHNVMKWTGDDVQD